MTEPVGQASGNARWVYYLADACRNLGDAEGAQTYYEETLRRAPYYAPTQLKLADLLFKQGQTDRAFSHYDMRLALVPRDPYARLGLGRIALQRGDRHAALGYLEAIAQDNPDFSSAHNLLSQIYASMGDVGSAEEQRRLSGNTGEWREPDDPWLSRMYAWSFDSFRLEILGGIRFRTQQLRTSLPLYEQAERLAPADAAVYEALGGIYTRLNELENARATFETGVAAAPNTPALYAALSQIQVTVGRRSESRRTLGRGLAVARQIGDKPSAARFEKLLSQDPP